MMDGGIYDNQGVDSILLYKENNNAPHFDLVIVSDVASPDMNPYKPFEETEKTNDWKSLTISQWGLHLKETSNDIWTNQSRLTPSHGK